MSRAKATSGPVTRKRGRDEAALPDTSSSPRITKKRRLGREQVPTPESSGHIAVGNRTRSQKKATQPGPSKSARTVKGKQTRTRQVSSKATIRVKSTGPRRSTRSSRREKRIRQEATPPETEEEANESSSRPTTTPENEEYEDEDEDGEDETQRTTSPAATKPGRKRAKTPEGAGDAVIDPSSHTMGALIKRHRLGKKSNLETALQEVDWSEVKRRRNEEKATALVAFNSGEGEQTIRDSEAEVNSRLDQAAKAPVINQRGPQLKIVDGAMVIDSSSLIPERQDPMTKPTADGAPFEEVEESDLTARVNRRSYMHSNHRNPVESLATAAGTGPWSVEQTQKFYNGLRMFGTDFTMISKMFPGRTRRNVKTKFTREEREYPDQVNAALLGEHVPIDLAKYAELTGKDQDYYKDPEDLRIEIEEAKELQRQEIERERAEQREAQQKKQEVEKAKLDAKAKRKEARANKAKDWQQRRLDIASEDRDEPTVAGASTHRDTIEEEEVVGPSEGAAYDDD